MALSKVPINHYKKVIIHSSVQVHIPVSLLTDVVFLIHSSFSRQKEEAYAVCQYVNEPNLSIQTLPKKHSRSLEKRVQI